MKLALLICPLLLFVSGCEFLYEFGFLDQKKAGKERPYVVLISIGGYRYDFTDKFSPPVLSKIAKKGVAAEALIPVYPSDTFPGQYSIATGLYPENHGIVGSNFYDPDTKREFIKNKDTITRDDSWFGGIPFWVAAEKQGVLAASMFWPGSEALIQGVRPSYFYYYDGSIDNQGRANQVVTWLELPEAKRPHMINVYFSDVDDKAHTFGVSSPEMRQAVMDVDRAIGKLVDYAEAKRLPVNFLIVAPHGIQDLDDRKTVYLEDSTDLTHLHIIGDKSRWSIYFEENERNQLERVYKELKPRENHFKVYKRENVPKRLNYSKNRKCGDLVIIADAPYSVKLARDPKKHLWSPLADHAAHGFDPISISNMHGIFYAIGPNVKAGLKISSFESIHIYPLLMKLLRLDVLGPIDGNAGVLEKIVLEQKTF